MPLDTPRNDATSMPSNALLLLRKYGLDQTTRANSFQQSRFVSKQKCIDQDSTLVKISKAKFKFRPMERKKVNLRGAYLMKKLSTMLFCTINLAHNTNDN